MGDDAVLRISTTVDLSGTQQLSAGASQMASSLQQAQAAFDKLTVAAKVAAENLRDANVQLGPAAAAGSAEAATVIKEYQEALDQAAAAAAEAKEQVLNLAASEAVQAASTNLSSVALTNNANASRTAYASARDLGGLLAGGSPMSLVSGLAQTARMAGPLQDILSAAFPVVGAVALVDILSIIPDQFQKMEDALSGWGEKAKAEFKERTKQLDAMVKQLDQVSRLTASSAGAGEQGTQRTAAEIAAQKQLNETLEKRFTLLQQLSEAVDKVKGNPISPVSDSIQLIGAGGDGISGAGEANQAQIEAFNAEVEKQKQIVTAASGAFTTYWNSINDQAKAAGLDIQDVTTAAQDFNHALNSGDVKSISAAYDKFKSSLDELKATIVTNDTEISSKSKEQTTEQIENARTAASQLLQVTLASISAQKAAAQLLYQQGAIDAQQWVEAQTSADTLAYQAHEDYFTKVKALYASNPQKEAAIEAEQAKFQYDDLAKSYAAAAEAGAKYDEEVRKLNQEEAAKAAEQQKQELDAHTKSVMELVKALQEQQKAQADVASTQRELSQSAQVQAINNAAALGVISEKQKAEMLLALYQQEEQELLAHLEKMREEQQQNVAALQSSVAADPNNTALKTALANAETQVAQSDQRILQVQQQFGAQINAQQLAIWKQMEAPMNNFFNSFEQSITRATGQWLTGSRSFVSAFEQAIGQIIVSEIEGVEKILLQDAFMWAKKAILHEQANATTAALNAAAATQQVAQTVATDTAQVISEAGLAAAKAYAAYAEFPPVAAVMAAEAEASVLGFLPQASAEGGFDVPSLPSMGMIANIHSREMVLPQEHADVIRSLAQGGGVGGGDFHYHAGDVSALDGNGVEQALNNNRKHVTNMVKQAFRRGAINPRRLI